MHAHKLLLLKFGKVSYITIKFTRGDCLQENNNLATRRCFWFLFTVLMENLPYFYFRSI